MNEGKSGSTGYSTPTSSPQFAATILDPTSTEFAKQLQRLVMPAMGVIETALTSRDEKLKIETAKWLLSCFPETAPKKVRDESEKGATPGGITVNLNQFNFEKLKHIAEGAKKLEKASYSIIGDSPLLPVHSPGNE